ncbi:autotransporter domain-containing protein [Neorhizobium lilium]|uniref:Autotransporter domain-containing protein n=2 Tax=Neorhizobium lilium TaxID=2503024 RepID=A0A3S3VLT7_9HYPH|nr:autotransporter domain-containing protein [Neorhizobium lilium]
MRTDGLGALARRLRLCTALVSLTISMPLPALAQSTWTGAGGSDFSDGANWNTAPAAPGAGDGAAIASGTPIVGSDSAVDTLAVSGGTLKIEAQLAAPGGTTLFDTGRIEASVGGELVSNVTMTDGYLGVSGTLTGDLDASAGTIINDGRITGETFIDGATLTNNGTLRDLIIASGGIATNNATGTVTGGTAVRDGTLTNNGALGSVEVGSAGTFTGNSGGNVGDLTNSGTSSNAGTIASLDNLAGGSFTNNSGGTVTGATVVTGGNVTNNATLGSVDVGSGGIFNNNTGAVAGAVTNAGNASNAGTVSSLVNTAGSFTNNSGGTVTGATGVTGGTLTNNGALAAVDIASGGAFTNNTAASAGAVTNAGDSTNAGAIGSLTNDGGTFTNNAGGSVSGATTIAGGSVTNNSIFDTVEVLSGGTFVNNLAGTTGAFTNAGTASNGGTIASLLNIDGTFFNSGTITGLASVTGGTLVNDGTISGGVDVDTGGFLAGSGSIGGLTVSNGGTLSPGPGIATLAIDGDVTFETGSTYSVDVDASGLSDLVTVSGTTTINGGTLQILAASGTYGLSTQYTVLTSGSLTGRFDDVTTDMAFLSPYVTYDATGVLLALYRNDVQFADVAETANGRAVANAINSLGTADPVFLAVLPLTADGANSAFRQLSGEIHASLKSQMLEDSRFVRNAVLDRMSGAVPTRQSDIGDATFWMTGFGAAGHTDGDGNAAGIDGHTGGVVAGADVEAFDNWRLGMLAGYSHTSVGRDADADSYHVGLYASADWGDLTFTGGAILSHNDISTDRNVSAGSLTDRLKSDYDSATRQLFADLSWRMRAGGIELRPFANLAYVNLDTDGFGESGGSAALSGRGGHDDVTMTTFGLRWAADMPVDDMPVTLSGMLGWRHAMGDLTPSSQLAFATGSPFMVEGVSLVRDAAVVEAALTAPLSKTAKLKLTYAGEFARRLVNHSIMLSVNVDF